jgi:hypothetical protein
MVAFPTIASIQTRKDEFLKALGCQFDYEEIAKSLGLDVEEETTEHSDEALGTLWIDALASRFSGVSTFAVYRHMSVNNFADYIEQLQAGEGSLGGFWSTEDTTRGPDPDGHMTEVLIAGEISANQVDWFWTFSQMFSHPWENEIVFNGGVCVFRIEKLGTTELWEPSSPKDLPQWLEGGVYETSGIDGYGM